MKFKNEQGSVIIDFVFYGVILQVGLLMVALQIFAAQSNQLAAESIARHGLRAYILYGLNPEITARQVLSDFDISRAANVSLICDPNCDTEEAVIKLHVLLGDAKAEAVAIR